MIIYIAFGAFVMLALGTAAALLMKSSTKSRKQVVAEVEQTWREVDTVAKQIKLYATMLFLHGPDSSECESFRFGVENEQLMGKTGAIKAFNIVANQLDSAWKEANKA